MPENTPSTAFANIDSKLFFVVVEMGEWRIFRGFIHP